MQKSDVDQALSDMRESDIAAEVERATVFDPDALNNAESALCEYGFDNEVQENFDSLVKYYCARQAGIARKGLCILGTVGTGKTFGMEFLMGTVKHSQELADLYQSNKPQFEFICFGDSYYHDYRNLFIDDLGAEATVVDYGTRIEVIEMIVSRRCAMFNRYGCKTFLTSNLTSKEIDERYGPRLFSRIREMCNIIIFTGPDRRGTGNEAYL